MQPAIRVKNLGKRYKIGLREQANQNFREALVGLATAPIRRLRRLREQAGEDETIWALKDVSFEVQPGEVVGIIGRNGAGKTTLLKILSRITEPTEGRVELAGRVASLLEVGTGFHPELTGRENIYLNGAILGMKKAEIDRRFDEIVAFAETEKFLDTPVKRYSSGMYVRLAFAVAAHLEPEILLVDEVLAVGDVHFQKKCLGKMQDVASGEGRTVMFVSHNIGAVQAICGRSILIDQGSVQMDDRSSAVATRYLESIEARAVCDLADRTDRRGKGDVRLTKVDISMGANRPSNRLLTGQPAQFVFHLNRVQPGLSCVFTLYDQHGRPVTHFNSSVGSPDAPLGRSTGTQVLCIVDELLLVPGRYRLNASVSCNGDLQDHVEGAALVTVEQGYVRGTVVPKDNTYGSVCLPHRWIMSP